MLNKIIGHLHIADECQRLFPFNIHSHSFPDYIRTKYNLPEIFYVDWRPFGPKWLFIADPAVAAQYVTTTQSLPKSSLEVGYMNRFLGGNNMVTLEGARWKSIRSMFNPGFSATNIMTLVDYIVDATLTFCDVMKEKAESNELFELEEYATRLTIDIIGKVTLDADMQAQKKLHPIVEAFRARVPMMPRADAIFPWQDVDVLRTLKLWWNGRQLNQAISDELDLKIIRRAKEIEAEASGTSKNKKRSVIDLALNAWEKEVAMAGEGKMSDVRITKPSQVPKGLRTDIVDQVKTFFFAGHDTTSSTMSYILYLLHRYPEVQAKLKTELDNFFPPGTSAADKIKSDPYIINKLEYTTAIIRETMRIFPPASTLRMVDPAHPPSHTMITDPRTGKQFPMAGSHIYPTAFMIHRNKRFFPQPTHFIPERFIPSQTPFPDAELFTPAGKEAFRPFEKGPRNCIGQELAMIETKIIMALTVREFDFILEYPGEPADLQYPIPDSTVEEYSENTEYGRAIREDPTKRNRVEGHRVFQVLKGSAKPTGGCPGRIRLR